MAKSILWASFKKSLLYRWRFIIAFALISLIFITVIFLLPLATNIGLSDPEMATAVESHQLNTQSLFSGNFANAVYLSLQKLSIHLFGLTAFAIKLPSMLLAVLSGLFIILLLNRWFTTSVAVIASALTLGATGFLFVATTGTPAISYLLLLSLILWLGSKILNETPNPLISALLAVAFGLALYTPYMIYLVLATIIISLIHPHLRFTIKTLPKPQLIIAIILFLLTISPIITSFVLAPAASFQSIALFENTNFADNIKASLALFSFKSTENIPVLVPILPLPTVLIALAGLVLALKNHHTSRNYLLLSFLLFAFISLSFTPDLFAVILLPITILVADSLQFLLERWNAIFPNNSYAKFISMLPVVIFAIFLSCSSIIYHFFGYRNIKEVNMFYNNDLRLLNAAVQPADIILIANDPPKLDFYRILEDKKQISVVDAIPDSIEQRLLVFRADKDYPKDRLSLQKILVSDRYNDADRLYIFEK
jgi:hypothetical protein